MADLIAITLTPEEAALVKHHLWNWLGGTTLRSYHQAFPDEALAWRVVDQIDAALTASPAGDDPKALDAAARSSSTEAVEQEVERLREDERDRLLRKATTESDGLNGLAEEEAWGAAVWLGRNGAVMPEKRIALRAALAPSLPGKEVAS